MTIPTIHKLEPAYLVLERLGGKITVARALKLNNSTLSRWCSPVPIGTGGSIPQRHWPALMRLAKKQGIRLTLDDLVQMRG